MAAAEPPPPESFAEWASGAEDHQFFRFEVLHESRRPGSRARVGKIHTPHGVIDTPAFVPVGTSAALKGITNEQAAAAGVQLMFCNTYHLLVHPGPQVVAEAGGLHSFMRRRGPIITDSGGFQVFSLARAGEGEGPELKQRVRRQGDAAVLKVSESGVTFRSYFDQSTLELTPESAVSAQKSLGADIIIPLDELPPYDITRERLAASVGLSHRWMARSLHAHLRDRRQQAMYAVVHGGIDRELRMQSAEYLSALPFDGMAIGGSLGRDRAEMLQLVDFVAKLLPRERPVHLLGIADPSSVAAAAPFGIDTFDSCYPTQIARHGTLLTREGPVHIKQGKYKRDWGPIDPTLHTVDASRAYLHHLARMREPLFDVLASLHNVYFMNLLFAEMRGRILADDL